MSSPFDHIDNIMLKNHKKRDQGVDGSKTLEPLNPRTLESFFFIFLLLLALSFNPSSLRSLDSYSNKDCLKCHEKPEISQTLRNGDTRSIHLDPSMWAQDIHQKKGMTCVDCHVQASPSLHLREGFKKVNCASCHPEEEEEFTKNIHFEYRNVTPEKTLPQCYDCHTKHHVLLHDNPESSIHETNIGKTCSICHDEVKVRGIFKGMSLGKISGHRKGDLSEKFDMNVCISCHYEDSAHGRKRAYKEYCSRCHDVRKKVDGILGPIHLNSAQWARFNYVGSGLAIFSLLGLGVFFGVRTRRKFIRKIWTWAKTEQDNGEEPKTRKRK